MTMDESSNTDRRGKIISQFKIFWNDVDEKRVVVLQFPNRDRKKPYNAKELLRPSTIRMKPNTGVIELEVPLDTQLKGHFNRAKAFEFGDQLAKNNTLKNGGSFGMAGGFGIGDIRARNPKGRDADGRHDPGFDENDDYAYAEAERQGKIMKNLTLAGKIQQFKEGDPIYAMATFRGDEIHFTKIDAICSLSPQYTHLDAAQDNEKITRMRDAELGAPAAEARAVNVTMKSGESENVKDGDIGQTLKALQEEPFQTMRWVDEDDDEAFAAFQDHLFYLADDNDSRLVSMLNKSAYLDAISAPKLDEKTMGQNVVKQHNIADDWNDDSDIEISTDDEVMQEAGQKEQREVVR